MGALPDLTTMSHMTSFLLHLPKSDLALADGRQLFSSRSLSRTLQRLVLQALEGVDHQLLGELLGQLPCLTTLSCRGWVQLGEDGVDEAHLQAACYVLSQRTQLRHLHLGVLPGAMVPALLALTNLTALPIGCFYYLPGPDFYMLAGHRMYRDAAPVDFQPVLQMLTSLRRLGVTNLHMGTRCSALLEDYSSNVPRRDRRQILEGVRRLPLLEELDLGGELYEKCELQLLLPTPDRLQRVLVLPPLLQRTRKVLQASVLVESSENLGAMGSLDWLV